MVTRRQAREWAVMMLCECDLNPPDSIEVALSDFWEMQQDVERKSIKEGEYGIKEAFSVALPQDDPKNAKVLEKHMASLDSMKEFAEIRIKGVLARINEIDASLEPCLDNWLMYRLGTVERNVLRLGAWELAYARDIPVPIAINEAVDLAKFFSDSQSGKFVNGVLDRYSKIVRAQQESSGN